jgi:hypothetical protein
MSQRLHRIALRSPVVFGRAMREEALIELRKEIRPRTPIDKGDLRRTERVVGPEMLGRRIVVSITAGSELVDYAWIVHEDLEAWHDVGEAKYIEGPLKESGPYMFTRIARRIRIERMM